MKPKSHSIRDTHRMYRGSSAFFERPALRVVCASLIFASTALSAASATVAANRNVSKLKAPALASTKWTKNLFGSRVDALVTNALLTPPVAESAGTALPWQPSFNVEGGTENLANGNLTQFQNITSWQSLGPAVSFSLVHNSQSTEPAGVLGAKWRHIYQVSVASTASNATVTYPDGRTLVYAKSGVNYVTPTGFYDTLTQDASGFKLTLKDGSELNFNTSGKVINQKDHYGNTVVFGYTGSNLTSVTDAVGRTLNLIYTGNKLTNINEFDGSSWTLSYDSLGRLQSVTEPTLTSTPVVTTFTYNSDNNIASRTNKNSQTWIYSYQGNKFSYVQDPLGHYSGQYSSNNPIKQSSIFQTVVEEGLLTVLPDLIASTYPAATEALAYVEDAAGYATEYGMDSQGRITAIRDGNGNQTNYTYDSNFNRTASIETGNAATTKTFDAKANVLTVTDPSGRTTSSIYNALNLVTSSTDSDNKTTTYTYNGYRLASITDPTNRTTTYNVGTNGLTNSVVDPAGKTTSYLYNAFGENTRVTDPLGNQTNFTFSQGKMVARTDARGRSTSYIYDSWDRLTNVDYPTSADQSFTYDNEGKMTQAIDGTGTRTYTYDALRRKVGQGDPRGNTVATYDFAGRLKTQTDVTGRLLQYTYDGNGRLQQVSDPNGWVQYTYDSRNRMIETLYSTGVKTVYAYDAAGRTTALTHRNSSTNAVILGYTNTFDNAGRMSQTTESTGAVTSYSYDASGRLLSENRTGANNYVSAYTYDNRGLRATAFRSEGGVASHNGIYTYDDAGRLTNVADTITTSGFGGNYTWNQDGTLASYPGVGYTRKMEYDEESRLVRISRDNGTSVTPVFEYGYGYDGARRWRKDLLGNTWDWYPCGVACCAGELVTMRSTNGGSTWSAVTSRLNNNAVTNNVLLQNAQGTAATATASLGTLAIVDTDGVYRTGSSVAVANGIMERTPNFDESLHAYSAGLNNANLEVVGATISVKWTACFDHCRTFTNPKNRETCWAVCTAAAAGGKFSCDSFFRYCMYLRGKPDFNREANMCMITYNAICAGA